MTDQANNQCLEQRDIDCISIRKFWFVIILTFLFFSILFSWFAPVGGWINQIFHSEILQEFDPGGWYMKSAHEFFSPVGEPLFSGHPGLPLQFILYGVQKGAYLLFAAGGNPGYTQWVARNVHYVYFIAKVVITCLHLLSFDLLFHAAKHIFQNNRIAIWSVLGYATSLPVLFYLNRISVEPLVVIFLAGAFLSIWKFGDAAELNQKIPLLGYSVLAALAAVTGFVTKMHQMGLLPIFLFVYILFIAIHKNTADRAYRVTALFLYTFVSLALFLFYSLFIDWNDFFYVWLGVKEISEIIPVLSFDTIMKHIYDISLSLNIVAGNEYEGYDEVLGEIVKLIILFIPAADQNGIYFFCEWMFVLIGVCGIVYYHKKHGKNHGKMYLLNSYVAFTLFIWMYKVYRDRDFGAFHYLFVFMFCLSIYFGYIMNMLEKWMRKNGYTLPHIVMIILCVFIVHSNSIFSFINTKITDIYEYKCCIQETHGILEDLGPNEKIGLKYYPEETYSLQNIHGFHPMFNPYKPNRISKLREEYGRIFKLIKMDNRTEESIKNEMKENNIKEIITDIKW